jgi:hypothetical protein
VSVALPWLEPTLVGRDLDDGRELYGVPLGPRSVAALVTREAVLVEDRAAQFTAHAAREDELIAQTVDGRLDEEEAFRRMETHPGVPVVLRVLDAGTGEERIRYEFPGDIVHVVALDVGAAVVASTPEGRGECLVLNRAGCEVARFPVPGRRLDFPWSIKDNDTPRVLAARGHTLLYAVADMLFGIDARSGEQLWEMPLPDRGVGFRPQTTERHLAKANVASDRDVLAIRGTDRLWVYDLAGC